MFGCLKVFNSKRTYDVTKPVPNVRQPATPAKRKVTKHSIQVPRPSIDEDDDSSLPENREEDLTTSTRTNVKGIENGSTPHTDANPTNNRTNENLTASGIEISRQNTESEETRKTNDETGKPDNDNEETRKISVENEETGRTGDVNEDIFREVNLTNNKAVAEEVGKIDENVQKGETSRKIEDVQEIPEIATVRNDNEDNSGSPAAKTRTDEKPNAETITISTPLNRSDESEAAAETRQISVANTQAETNERHEETSTPLNQPENQQSHQAIVANKTTRGHEETNGVPINDSTQQEMIHVQTERVQVHGYSHGNNSIQQTSEGTHQNQTGVFPVGPQEHATFSTVGNQNVVTQGTAMNVTNAVQNGQVLNQVPIEIQINVEQAQKPDGVKFTDEIEVLIYSSSDSESIYDGEGDNSGLPKERREGVRETVKIDGEQDIKTYPKSEEEALEIKKAYRANEFLETVLKDDQLNTLVDAMYLREVEENEVIIQEGEPGNHLYVSAGGTFDVYVNQKKVNSFSDFRVFGELAILYNAKRMATIKSTTAGRIWVLHRSIYQRTLVQDAIRDYEETLSFLQNVPAINSMNPEKLRKVANLLKKEFFKTDTVIVQQGDVGDKFYIIRAGNVTVTKKDEGKVAELSKGAYFGERALLQEDCRQATVTADPPGVECLTLTRAEFKEHFDDDQFGQSGGDQQSQAQPATESKEPGEFAEIQLDDLKRVETLGVGGFGRVELVQHKKQANLTFALKYLKKVDMIQQGQVDHVFSEKNIQISCDSVFVVRMYKTFSDNKYLYFLMESCLGGDLWTYLQKQKGRHVGDTAARFFAGCVLEALTYLHDRDYIYRDLKPENLIIDGNGYIKLTDFGFAKYIGRNGRTFTFAGTPEYVAPEIVYNRGHDKAVDYWAFGIFIFELLVGKTPFRSDDPSHMRTYNRILRGINSVQFPPTVSGHAVTIIKKLCKAIPTERLGCQKNGAQDIRNHKWFQPLDWNKLRNRKVKTPFLPKLQNNTDTKHFEKFKPDDDVPPDELVGFDDFES